jgi:hypothetical protein
VRTLACVIVYNRPDMLAKWLRAWKHADQMGIPLTVIHSLGGTPEAHVKALAVDGGATYMPRHNIGMDIGALKEVFLRRMASAFDPNPSALTSWDTLFWATDDALPMRKDFMYYFTQPFEEPLVGMVSNYILPDGTYDNVPEHARTVCFAIRKEAVCRVEFPPTLETKDNCWSFEWGAYNLHKQVQSMGYQSIPANLGAWPRGSKPWYMCNDLIWDCGEINLDIQHDWRRKQDFWDRYEAQFSDKSAEGGTG